MKSPRERVVKKLAAFLLMALSNVGYTAGNTAWAVPTQVDVMYAGIMVHGAFGNSGGCTVADRFFVPINTGQYKEIYATLMLAFSTGKEVSAYINGCDSVGWYAASNVTFNYMVNSGVLYMRN
jgi:hypothetical protein